MIILQPGQPVRVNYSSSSSSLDTYDIGKYSIDEAGTEATIKEVIITTSDGLEITCNDTTTDKVSIRLDTEDTNSTGVVYGPDEDDSVSLPSGEKLVLRLREIDYCEEQTDGTIKKCKMLVLASQPYTCS